MGEGAICCRGIRKGYGHGSQRVEALRGIDLSIEEGKLTLLVGPSGSGKTTLLSIITTILTPDEGELTLLGQNPFILSDKERAQFCRNHLSIVFQSLFLIPTLTVAENVSLPLLIAGWKEADAMDHAMETLRRMHLLPHATVSPFQLSRGQQQRVAIARAMVTDTSIIVCDEPTSSLDQARGIEIMSLLHELTLQALKTVLVVTHDHRIFSLADKIVTINDGRITDNDG